MDDDTQALREMEEFRAGAAERGGAMILLRHDYGPEGAALEPLFVGLRTAGGRIDGPEDPRR